MNTENPNIYTQPVEGSRIGFERANNLKEACHRLGCSRSSLYAMAGQGLITFRKIGGRTVVMESEIMRILREAPQAVIRTRG